MELKPGYKRTEVGVIPEDWEVVPLADLFSFRNGFGAGKEAYGHGIPFINVLDVITNSHIHQSTINGKVTLPTTSRQSFSSRRGDIFFNRTSETKEDSGLAAVYCGDIEVVFGCFVIRGRPKSDNLDVEYSGFALRAKCIRSQMIARGQGAIHSNISQGDIKSVLIPRPPLTEQRAIAAALTDVDALLAKLDQLLAKKRDLKQAAMQQLLTGKRRLPGFSGEWEEKRLGEMFLFKNGLNKGKIYFGHGTPIVNYMDVYNGSALLCSSIMGKVEVSPDERQTYDVKKGDVFFTRTSETVDEIGIASVMLDTPSDTVFSGFLLRARPKTDRLRDEFKRYCFLSNSVRAQIMSRSSYTTRALTNGRLLSSVVLQVPKPEEQTAIAAVLSDMDAEIAELEARRDKTRALKQGMMQELLTGRIRLV